MKLDDSILLDTIEEYGLFLSETTALLKWGGDEQYRRPDAQSGH